MLVAELLGDDPVASEAAAARLAILGRPSIRAVLHALEDATPVHAVLLLGVLERIADPLALPAVAAMLDRRAPETDEAAVCALAALLQAPRASVSAAALDHLTATALDVERDRTVRLAALQAISSIDLEAVALVRAQLLSDQDEDIRRAAGHEDTSLGASLDGGLPEDPEVLRVALGRAEGVSVSDLHRLVVALRDAERGAASPATSLGWLTCRAAVHQALASRDSRVAVYDLRDTLEARGPETPVGMLSALRDVGDAASLEVLVEAWAAHEDAWFRSQLASAFTAIVGREGLTRRHAVLRRAAQRRPDAVAALWAATQSRTSSSTSR